jgi:hypothetical protein
MASLGRRTTTTPVTSGSDWPAASASSSHLLAPAARPVPPPGSRPEPGSCPPAPHAARSAGCRDGLARMDAEGRGTCHEAAGLPVRSSDRPKGIAYGKRHGHPRALGVRGRGGRTAEVAAHQRAQHRQRLQDLAVADVPHAGAQAQAEGAAPRLRTERVRPQLAPQGGLRRGRWVDQPVQPRQPVGPQAALQREQILEQPDRRRHRPGVEFENWSGRSPARQARHLRWLEAR